MSARRRRIETSREAVSGRSMVAVRGAVSSGVAMVEWSGYSRKAVPAEQIKLV